MSEDTSQPEPPVENSHEKASTQTRRRRIVIAAIAVALVIGAGLSGYYAVRHNPEPRSVPTTTTHPPSTTIPTPDTLPILVDLEAELREVPGDATAVDDYMNGDGSSLKAFEAAFIDYTLAGSLSCSDLDSTLDGFDPQQISVMAGEVPDPVLREGYASLYRRVDAMAAECNTTQSEYVSALPLEDLRKSIVGLNARYRALGIRT